MGSMRKPKRRTRRRSLSRRLRRALVGVMALLAAALAFAIEYTGGRGVLPDWSELYALLGVPMDAPDATLLENSTTTVTVLDVGQGDAVLVGQDGVYCLIDTGTAESGPVLVRDLQLAGVTELEYLFLTHPHADHTGGVWDVLESLPVGELVLADWQPRDGDETDWPYGLTDYAAEAGTTVTVAADGEDYILGNGTLTVLQGGSTEETYRDQLPGDANNASLCLLFEAGGFRYLSTGDAETKAERLLVDRYGRSLQATLYKAGHHGSQTSSSEELLAAVRPQMAAISCGVDNDYGHPHATVLRRLQEYGVEIWRTDTVGSITFTYHNGALEAHPVQLQDAAA